MTQHIFNWTILLALIVGLSSCNGQVKKDLSKETQSESILISDGHPKLIKTQDSKAWDNLNSSLQDKAGNLWFGTTAEGIYKYDGKSFRQFTMADGLNSNMIYCLFEDKDANLGSEPKLGFVFMMAKHLRKFKLICPAVYRPTKSQELMMYSILHKTKTGNYGLQPLTVFISTMKNHLLILS